MNMPAEILTFLLRCGHLNVEERKAKGLWPNERLRYSEVLAHLTAVIDEVEWFPQVMPNHKQGEFVFEGTLIQRIGPNHFVCHSGSWGKESTHECRNARDAAAFYLKWDLGIPPGTLDSWIVE